MLDHEIEECYRTVEQLARQVGEVIKEAFYQEKEIETKATHADLVTETDQKVEDTLISTLKSKYPSHCFIGEESTAAGVKADLTDNPTWIIDPIDGTSNFVHGLPHIAVSIALLVNKQPEIGLIYNPIMNEMFTARPGKGALCNGKQIKVTTTSDLGKAMLCTEFGNSRDPAKLDAKVRNMRKIINEARGIRSLGSAAISMSFVAAGRVDAYYETGIHAWDIAAGDLIVREAGGAVIDTAGGPLDLMCRRVLCASTETLAKQVCSHLEPIEFERD